MTRVVRSSVRSKPKNASACIEEELSEPAASVGDAAILLCVWVVFALQRELLTARARCGVRGLSARVSSGRRVKLARTSPDVGVNRRRRVRTTLWLRGTISKIGGENENSASEFLEQRASTEPLLRDFGGHLGSRRGKCLANAVLACCRGCRWERMRRALASRCDNEDGAGLCGQEREKWNFGSVRACLEAKNAYVRV